MKIRDFAVADGDRVANIVDAAFRPFLAEKLGDDVERLFPRRSGACWAASSFGADEYSETVSFVADEGGVVYGYLQINSTPTGLGSLNIIAVSPDAPVKGIGHALFVEAEKYWRAKNQRKIATCVSSHNKHALNYYLKHGFIPEGLRRDHFFAGVDEIMLGLFL